MVRAKFYVTRVESSVYTKYVGKDLPYEKTEMRTIVLMPVAYAEGKHPENKMFWDASPSGEIRLGTVNPAAWQAFELDKEYYIDFTPVQSVNE